MSDKTHYEWKEVVDLQPKGYLELQNPETKTVIHGPIESISIDEFDLVRIKLKWAAKMGTPGTPTFMKWRNSPENTEVVFPNLVVPFSFQDTEKGKRVLFGFNILYIDPVRGLDSKMVEGLRI
jgi:hypothetical protein